MTDGRWREDDQDDPPFATEPRPVAAGLDALARRLGAPAASSLGAVFGRWKETVGDGLAAHCRPVALHDGILTVAVDQPVWATQLRYLTPQLLEKLAVAVGPNLVGRVEIRVDGGDSRGRRRGGDD